MFIDTYLIHEHKDLNTDINDIIENTMIFFIDINIQNLI